MASPGRLRSGQQQFLAARSAWPGRCCRRPCSGPASASFTPRSETSTSNTGAFATAGFSATTALVGSLDGITPFNYLRNPFPSGLVKATGSSLGAATFLGQSFAVYDPNPHTPYALQWNADLQRALPGNLLIDVAYSANRGVHLAQPRDLDALPPQNLALGTGLQGLVPNPFAGTITSGTLAQPNVARQQLLLPYPQFTDVSLMNSTSGNSIYHSLQLKAEKRLSKGVSFLVAYTAGKMLSDTNASLAGFANSGQTRRCRTGTTCGRSGRSPSST